MPLSAGTLEDNCRLVQEAMAFDNPVEVGGWPVQFDTNPEDPNQVYDGRLKLLFNPIAEQTEDDDGGTLDPGGR